MMEKWLMRRVFIRKCLLLLTLLLPLLAHSQMPSGTWSKIKHTGPYPTTALKGSFVSLEDGGFAFCCGNAVDLQNPYTWLVNQNLSIFRVSPSNPLVGTWTMHPFPSNFQPRTETNMVFKKTTRELIFFGGVTLGDVPAQQLWTVNLNNMQWIIRTILPNALVDYAPMPIRNSDLRWINETHLVLAGGFANIPTRTINNFIWFLDTTTWTWSRMNSPYNFNKPYVSLTAKAAIFGDIMYQSFLCTGDSACTDPYDNGYMAFNTSTSPWTVRYKSMRDVYVNGTVYADYPNWPAESDYGLSLIPHGKFWWRLGGLTFDIDPNSKHVNAMNMETFEWQYVNEFGTAPVLDIQYSLASWNNIIYALAESSLNAPDNFYAFVLDKQLQTYNFFTNQTMLQQARAGQVTSFEIQLRECTFNSAGGCTWGNLIRWATNLDLSVTLAATESENIPIIKADVVEVEPGIFNVSFVPQQGRVFDVFIQYQKQDVLGSPFQFEMLASQASCISTAVTGHGVTPGQTLRGKKSSFALVQKDRFGNVIRFPTSSDVNSISISVTSGSSTLATVKGLQSTNPSVCTIVQTSDGVFDVQYVVPEKDYELHVAIAGCTIYKQTLVPQDPIMINKSLAAAMKALAAIAMALQFVYAALLWHHWTKPVIKASSPRMLIVLLIGSLCAISTVFLLDEPSQRTCPAIPFLGGSGFALMLSCLLATTWRIDKIFSSTTLSVTRITDNQLLLFAFAFLGIEILIDAIWAGVNPLGAIDVLVSNSTYLTYSVCSSANTSAWYGIFLGYKGLLALYLVFLATKSRNVPSMFNESQTLAVVVHNLSLVSLVVTAIVLLLSEKRDTQYAITCISLVYLSVSTTSILLVQKFLRCNSNTQESKMKTTAASTSVSSRQ